MPFNKSHPVPQEDITGCAIACTAWITGNSYDVVKTTTEKIGISITNPKLWSDINPVRTILTEFGITLSANPTEFTGWQFLPETSLLAVKYHLENEIPHWHWVVAVKTTNEAFVMDPKKALRTNIRTDFGRMKPKWYWQIH